MVNNILFKLNKMFFLKSMNLISLKKYIYKFSNFLFRVNIFFSFKEYVIDSSYKYLYIKLNQSHIKHKINQLVFNKKPFSGPIIYNKKKNNIRISGKIKSKGIK